MSELTARDPSSLHGKQLVFLFMSVVVLAVVIFLCGVMVGRGVRGAQVPSEASGEAVDPTVVGDLAGTMPDLPADVGEPVELQYPNGLTAGQPPPDPPLEPVGEALPGTAPQAVGGTGAAAGATSSRDEPPASEAVAPELAEPPGSGFVVQVHAARQHAEALGIARRLASQGYRAFVTTSGSGPAMMYRVRVGKFPDRQTAKAVSDKLEAEEHFKPWITR